MPASPSDFQPLKTPSPSSLKDLAATTRTSSFASASDNCNADPCILKRNGNISKSNSAAGGFIEPGRPEFVLTTVDEVLGVDLEPGRVTMFPVVM